MTRRRIKILTSIVLVVAVAIIVIIIADHFMNTPSNGSINVGTGSLTTVSPINMTPKLVTTSYVSFDYPSGMKVAVAQQPSPPVLGNYDYSFKDFESWQLNISIISVPHGLLSNNSAYQLRKANPETYQETHEVLGSNNVDVMTDVTSSGFSKVAFLVDGPYQATISLEGNDQSGTSSLEATFNMVLSSWHWLVT